MSQNRCSLAIDDEEELTSLEMEGALRLVVDRRLHLDDGYSPKQIASNDVVTFSGTITVSF